MKKTKDPNRKFYFKVLNHLETEMLFKDIAKHQQDLSIWQKGMNEKDLEYFEVSSRIDKTSKFILNKKGKFLQKFMKSTLSDSAVFVKFNIGKKIYFAQGKLAHEKANDYELQVSGQLFICQQRQNYRLNSSKNIKIQIRVEDEIFDCIDISAGGVSFIVEGDHIRDFYTGRQLDVFRCAINKEIFDIPNMRVIASRELRSPEGMFLGKYGVSGHFAKIPKSVEENLRRFINYEARGLEIRKKFNLN